MRLWLVWPRIDDVIDGFSVHAVGGLVGAVFTGFFTRRQLAYEAGFKDYDGVAVQVTLATHLRCLQACLLHSH